MSLKKPVKLLMKILLFLIMAGFLFFSFPQIYGFKCYVVISGSMYPALPIGSAVYLKEENPKNIKPGQIITFSTESGDTLITHRVVKNDLMQHLFVTKGDANASQDVKPVRWKALQGRVVFCVPFAGYALKFMGSWKGKFAAAFFLLACYLLSEVFFEDSKECETN